LLFVVVTAFSTLLRLSICVALFRWYVVYIFALRCLPRVVRLLRSLLFCFRCSARYVRCLLPFVDSVPLTLFVCLRSRSRLFVRFRCFVVAVRSRSRLLAVRCRFYVGRSTFDFFVCCGSLRLVPFAFPLLISAFVGGYSFVCVCSHLWRLPFPCVRLLRVSVRFVLFSFAFAFRCVVRCYVSRLRCCSFAFHALFALLLVRSLRPVARSFRCCCVDFRSLRLVALRLFVSLVRLFPLSFHGSLSLSRCGRCRSVAVPFVLRCSVCFVVCSFRLFRFVAFLVHFTFYVVRLVVVYRCSFRLLRCYVCFVSRSRVYCSRFFRLFVCYLPSVSFGCVVPVYVWLVLLLFLRSLFVAFVDSRSPCLFTLPLFCCSFSRCYLPVCSFVVLRFLRCRYVVVDRSLNVLDTCSWFVLVTFSLFAFNSCFHRVVVFTVAFGGRLLFVYVVRYFIVAVAHVRLRCLVRLRSFPRWVCLFVLRLPALPRCSCRCVLSRSVCSRFVASFCFVPFVAFVCSRSLRCVSSVTTLRCVCFHVCVDCVLSCLRSLFGRV